MFNVLVLGGSGFVGRSVCEQLVDRSGGANGRIRVGTRRPGRARPIQLLPTVEIAAGDVHDDATLARWVAGMHAVVNLVATRHGSDEELARAHVRLAERLARACVNGGVRRLVHVSAIGAEANAPSRYLRSRAAAEAVLRGAGLDLTILRPSVIFGERDRFMNLFARMQAYSPFVPLAAADARFQPVWVVDVAAAVVRCLEDRTTFGETIECCGPTPYTLHELVGLAGRWSGHERPIWKLPAALGRLQAFTFEMLPGQPLLSRDDLASMQTANVASGSLPGLDRLRIRPTPLESVAPAYLGVGRGPARLDPLRARARRG